MARQEKAGGNQEAASENFSAPLPVPGLGSAENLSFSPPDISTSCPSTSLYAIERMPPLLSYDETGPSGRSASLHGVSLLSEEEQVGLPGSPTPSSALIVMSLAPPAAQPRGQSVPRL